MKTDVIVVSSKGNQMETALSQVEKVAAYKGLPAKGALHLRLLTEEMMSMMRSITGETEGKFWIEDNDGVYELHLLCETRMTSGKREKLLSTSSTGKNESARGLMGKLRDFFDRGADEDIAPFTNSLLMPSMYETGAVLRRAAPRAGRPGRLGRTGKIRRRPRGGRCKGQHPQPPGGNDHH